jgi:4,5-dihydroxyphthalate decarboxylase
MTQPAALPLKFAIATYGHTAAIKNGSIPIEGVQPEFVEVNPQIAAYRRMVRNVEFDVCEIAPSTYMIAREHGAPFKALPIFVSRNFHHSGFVYRPDAGIRQPRDLEGKNAGVRAYSVTTGVWTRGILQNEYGIDISKITWWVDDEEHVTTLKLPPYVKHVPEGKSLVSMMASGELQAAFTANAGIGRVGAPKEGWAAGAATPAQTNYVEFFRDSRKLEKEWYERTGIYPFHGTIVVKDAVLERYPWVAQSLFRAFTAAKERWLENLPPPEQASGKDRQLAEMRAIVGSDPLPYGIAGNRASIEALIRFVHQQGMLRRGYSVDELFVDPEAA